MLTKFQEQTASAFQITARDLAHGITTRQPSVEDAQNWVKSMLLDLPLCDTGFGQQLGGLLGLGAQQMKLSPNELGKDVGNKVTGWVDEQKQDHPALFWSGATLAAIGAGALTYSQGTGFLQKVGALLEQALGPRHRDLARALAKMGGHFQRIGDGERATRCRLRVEGILGAQ